jgi:flagellar hook assembly protein FlgD
VLTNGARFASNFAIVDNSGNPYANLKFAASGNDLIATTGETFTVTFNLNGGVGAAPPPIRIVANGRLGAAAMPPTAGYLDAGNHLNDGKWYKKISESGDLNPAPFNFDALEGTRVAEDIVLALYWTDEVSVLANGRVIPSKPGAEIVVIAPVTVTAGELTAGPNPAAKSGAVNFFWNGKGLASGKLFIYDASGSLVRKIAVADNTTANNGRRAVGSWDLADAKGRPVSDGTYLVRGAVAAKDGAKVKASVLVGVARE